MCACVPLLSPDAAVGLSSEKVGKKPSSSNGSDTTVIGVVERGALTFPAAISALEPAVAAAAAAPSAGKFAGASCSHGGGGGGGGDVGGGGGSTKVGSNGRMTGAGTNVLARRMTGVSAAGAAAAGAFVSGAVNGGNFAGLLPVAAWDAAPNGDASIGGKAEDEEEAVPRGFAAATPAPALGATPGAASVVAVVVVGLRTSPATLFSGICVGAGAGAGAGVSVGACVCVWDWDWVTVSGGVGGCAAARAAKSANGNRTALTVAVRTGRFMVERVGDAGTLPVGGGTDAEA